MSFSVWKPKKKGWGKLNSREGEKSRKPKFWKSWLQTSQNGSGPLPGLSGPLSSLLLLNPALQPGVGVSAYIPKELFPARPGAPAPSQGVGTQQNLRKEAEGGCPAQVCLNPSSIYPSIHLHTHTHIHPSIHPPLLYLPIYLYTQTYTHTHPPTHLHCLPIHPFTQA